MIVVKRCVRRIFTMLRRTCIDIVKLLHTPMCRYLIITVYLPTDNFLFITQRLHIGSKMNRAFCDLVSNIRMTRRLC